MTDVALTLEQRSPTFFWRHGPVYDNNIFTDWDRCLRAHFG